MREKDKREQERTGQNGRQRTHPQTSQGYARSKTSKLKLKRKRTKKRNTEKTSRAQSETRGKAFTGLYGDARICTGSLKPYLNMYTYAGSRIGLAYHIVATPFLSKSVILTRSV